MSRDIHRYRCPRTKQRYVAKWVCPVPRYLAPSSSYALRCTRPTAFENWRPYTGERGWIGDAELGLALIDRAERRASELVPIAVDLDDLADVIDEAPSSESYIDLESGVVWPGELLDLGQGPYGFDPDDAGRWLLVGRAAVRGSRSGRSGQASSCSP